MLCCLIFISTRPESFRLHAEFRSMNYQILNKYTWFRLCCFTYYFYRATLCESAVFAIGRCLSVTFVYCIQTAEYNTLGPVATSVVFLSKRRCSILSGAPSAGAQNTRGRKKLRFSTKTAVYLENGTRYEYALLWNVIAGGLYCVGSDDLE